MHTAFSTNICIYQKKKLSVPINLLFHICFYTSVKIIFIQMEESNKNNHVSIEIMKGDVSIELMNGDSISLVADSIREELRSLSPLSSECCIHRVPKRHRQVEKDVYTPQVVSIGPYHHGEPGLIAMEEYKKRYLNDFLKRLTKKSLEDCVKLIKEKEARLRNSYTETITLCSDDFVKMVLVDAAFIVELILKHNSEEQEPDESQDRVLGKPFMVVDLWIDLWLLENQLPFFILDELFKLSIYFASDGRESNIIQLACNFFRVLPDLKLDQGNLRELDSSKVLHLLDLLRLCNRPFMSRPEWNLRTLNIPSATELSEAGVKFVVASSCRSLFDVQFNNGVLTIPRLTIGERTESLVRNLLAYEQCQFKGDLYMNDYIFFMDRLLNSPKDAEFLIRRGIVENQLNNSAQVSSLISNVVKEALLLPNNFYFAGLCERLIAYSQRPWHQWEAILKKNYFKNPWTSASTIAAIVLLLLTLIQTIFAVISA